MKRSVLAFCAATAAASLAIGSGVAGAGPCGSHPYFADGGTLAWYTDLGEAQAAARSSGKVVFIEYGRRACTNCRTLVSKYLPCPLLRDRFSDLCVGLAADCDEPDARVEALFKTALPDASSLPFAAFVMPDLTWLSGWAGATTPCDIAGHLTVAETRRAQAAVARVAAAKAAPAPTPTAPPPPAPTCATSPAPAVGSPRPPTGRSTPAADVEKARALFSRAKAADAAGRRGEVLRLDVEAGRLSVRVEPAEWAAMDLRAAAWAEQCLQCAATAAKARRCDEASKLIGDVKREMAGQTAEADAARGERALGTLKTVDAAPATGKESVRAAAVKEFQGSRWASIFEG